MADEIHDSLLKISRDYWDRQGNSPHVHQSNTGFCQVGNSHLEFEPGMALRLLALEGQGV
jgi:hypothetical protein